MQSGNLQLRTMVNVDPIEVTIFEQWVKNGRKVHKRFPLFFVRNLELYNEKFAKKFGLGNEIMKRINTRGIIGKLMWSEDDRECQ